MHTRNSWLTYAAVMMFIAAALHVVWALNLWADSAWVADVSNGILGGQRWLWGLFDAALAVVDWTTEIVVAGTYFAASSCGGTLSLVEALDVAGATHVSMAMLDTSYACPWLCEASLQAVWVVAVPRGAEPATACLGVGGGCGELPG